MVTCSFVEQQPEMNETMHATGRKLLVSPAPTFPPPLAVLSEKSAKIVQENILI